MFSTKTFLLLCHLSCKAVTGEMREVLRLQPAVISHTKELLFQICSDTRKNKPKYERVCSKKFPSEEAGRRTGVNRRKKLKNQTRIFKRPLTSCFLPRVRKTPRTNQIPQRTQGLPVIITRNYLGSGHQRNIPFERTVLNRGSQMVC